ncbi:unnamed protein product [Periconia digitata]|uniref:Mso1 N-terminal domain-containing protein n=1 Tax=Periconia digitata TaxID=1303443 RepID=A0A9W4XMJ1_9PLEO|nr:unnamed protein product [Periconia digitata]
MSSYLNNLLTTTTSRYNSLRRQLLSDEVDGDTEDDSHISRGLRAYYTEKGRPFPPWLPPDPKAPQAAPAQMVSSSGRGYGNMGPPQQQMGRGSAAINDLWDGPSQPQQQQEPMSLRRAQLGRGGGGRQGLAPSRSPEPQMQGRPLPSQRAGSYQTGGDRFRPSETSPPPSAGSGVSAQDRLKARLWGSGRSSSPSNTPSQSSSPAPSGGRQSPYDQRGGGGRSPYPDDRSGGGYSGGRSGGGGRQQDESSYKMSSNSPWTDNDDPYGPSYNSAPPQPSSGGRRMGLPSGPRMR